MDNGGTICEKSLTEDLVNNWIPFSVHRTYGSTFQEFQVKLYGNDNSGRSFTRKLSEFYKPSSVELQITAPSGRCIGTLQLLLIVFTTTLT